MSHIMREMAHLHDILDNLLRELQRMGDSKAGFIPPVDTVVTEEKIIIIMDAPGIGKDDVEVFYQGGLLTIRGKKTLRETSNRKHLLIERTHGHFSRTLPINEALNLNSASATLRRGVLTVELPRVQEKRKHVYTIPVEEQ